MLNAKDPKRDVTPNYSVMNSLGLTRNWTIVFWYGMMKIFDISPSLVQAFPGLLIEVLNIPFYIKLFLVWCDENTTYF